MRLIGSITSILVFFLVWGCQWGPKEKEMKMPGHFNTGKAFDSGLYFDLHKVEVLELLPSDSYVYMQVSENDKFFWIAARPSDYHLDSTYYYNEALLKTEFKSKQLNRVFDSIYLVTNLVRELHYLDQEIH